MLGIDRRSVMFRQKQREGAKTARGGLEEDG